MGVHAQLTDTLIGITGTYAQIKALVTAGTLQPGAVYRITDNQTIHIIPNSNALNVHGTVYENPFSWDPNKPIKDEGVEELLITANSTTTFSPIVYSITYPKDIIYFDFNDILCEDTWTPRRGKITYRKDITKGLETYYDWRKVKFRRYKINPPVWGAATPYSRGAAVLASDGGVYVSKKFGTNTNVGNDPNLAAYWGAVDRGEWAIKTDPNWLKVLVPSRTFYLSTSSTSCVLAFATIPAIATDFQDSYTFNTSIAGGDGGAMRNISIKSAATYNNIIFIDSSVNGTPSPANSAGDGNSFHDNTFDFNCSNMTFTNGNVFANSFGQSCTNNIIQGGFNFNFCDNNFSNNHFVLVRSGYLNATNRNFFAASCTYNIFNPETQYNHFAGLFYQNSFELQASGNEMMGSSYICNYGNGWKSNKTEETYQLQCGNTCEYNRFSARISNIIIGNSYKHNTATNLNGTALGNSVIGNNVQQNLINGMQTNMNLPDNFQFNAIKGVLDAGTTFAAGCSGNTMNANFGGGTVSVPLYLINCVFNQPVTGLQVSNVAVALTKVTANNAITSKTIQTSQTGTVLTTSPDGNIWSSFTQNTTGAISSFQVS